MSMDAISTAAGTVKKFVATKPGFIKTSRKWAKDLPESEKIAFEPGAELNARQTGTDFEFILIADAVMDGKALEPRFTYIHSGQWAAAAAAGMAPKTAPAAAETKTAPPEAAPVDRRKAKRQRRKSEKTAATV